MSLSSNKIGYSTAGFVDRDLEEALRTIGAEGYDRVEIGALDRHLAGRLEGNAPTELRDMLEEVGLSGGTVHAPMGETVLGGTDEEWRKKNVDVYSRFLEFAHAIGSTGLVVHPVPNPAIPEVLAAADRVRDAVIKSLDELVPVAQRTGVRLLLENLPFYGEFPLLTMQELRPVVDDYPASAVGLVIDTGHAWTRGVDPASEIRAAGDRLHATHIQDVDYDNPRDNHWPPTQGGLDWDSILDALKEIGYADTLTFEILRGRNGETPEEMAQICRGLAGTWRGEA
jgi:sugar phosphate isomerase/epimerase